RNEIEAPRLCVPVGNPIHGRTCLRRQTRIISSDRAVPCSADRRESSARRFGEHRSSLGYFAGENRHSYFWIDTAPRTASFRLRAAHSGGEDRRPAECRRPLRTPTVALLAFPTDPRPTTGAFGMRDGTKERTSRAGTRKLRENDHMIESLAAQRAGGVPRRLA